MIENSVINTMLNRKSIRHYKADMPTDEIIHTIVRAGQQAPFAYQIYSILLSRNQEKNAFKAPLLFTICVDCHKLECIMAKRGWKIETNDLSMLIFGIQDAALMAENMVIVAESLGLGSCFLGAALYRAQQIAQKYNLPQRVMPLVQLTIGYPDEAPPPRPRYPMDFVLFEDEYADFNDELIEAAMEEMDTGYLEQDYYRNANYKIPLQKGKEETFTFDDYSWTEHISRKAGQWYASPDFLLEQLRKRGFKV